MIPSSSTNWQVSPFFWPCRGERVAAILLSLLVAVTGTLAAETTDPLGSLTISAQGKSRPYAYTNGQTAVWYAESNSRPLNGWQGFSVMGHLFLRDYHILIDGKELNPADCVAAIRPDFLVRTYPGGIREVLHPVDSLAAIILTITAPRPIEITVIPIPGSALGGDLIVNATGGTISLASRSHRSPTIDQPFPAWLTIATDGMIPLTVRSAGAESISLTSSLRRSHTLVISVGDTQRGTEEIARRCLLHTADLISSRRERLEAILRRTATTTGNARFDRALAWAKLSLDALCMNQGSYGIFAGLPWFNNYWGRDTFITLPGAALATGDFLKAKRILDAFAAEQELDSGSTDYGRIPNYFSPTERAYNTADGTPRFVLAAIDYIERSGDTLFAMAQYPTILRSIEGTLRYHTDSLGFLIHADAETWMDAVGPEGPWSPRGNRANDVQALWAGQLSAGIALATRFGDVASARRWNAALVNLRRNFARYFVTPNGIPDHLRPDGAPDFSLRPNVIFSTTLLGDSLQSCVLDSVVRRLTYPYGVASLSQNDVNFHPYHQYPGMYPKDASYHNGTVWTWLQGPVISALCSRGGKELAWRVTQNSVHQILDRGAAGTQSELLDALPHPGESEPRLSGTFSQAWNLGEFVRNFIDDYCGARIDLSRNSCTLFPNLPSALGNVRTRVRAGQSYVDVTFALNGNRPRIELTSGTSEALSCTIRFPDPGGSWDDVHVNLLPAESLSIERSSQGLVKKSHGKTEKLPAIHGSLPEARRLSRTLHLAEPHLRSGLKALRGPGYPLLPSITPVSSRRRVLVDVQDPEGDDTGHGGYSYPSNALFRKGSFDLRRFTLEEDSTSLVFSITCTALSDPGWHPEYGFQLTFFSILIDTDGVAGTGENRVARNAHWQLPDSLGYELVIYVGGGVLVEDRKGSPLAGYVPMEGDKPPLLGDPATGRVRFALPISLLGHPSPRWMFTILSGAQDDHGGSGIGEFRTVNPDRGEWNGGGRPTPDLPNVYDVLTTDPRTH